MEDYSTKHKRRIKPYTVHNTIHRIQYNTLKGDLARVETPVWSGDTPS